MSVITKEAVTTFITNAVQGRDACFQLLDKETDKDVIAKAVTDWWTTYMAPDTDDDEKTCMMRPSGNPLYCEEYVQMHTSGLIKNSSAKLVSMDHIRIMAGGQAAVVSVVEDQIFTYQGTPNEDRATVTFVLELLDGKLKIVHGHRGAGNPIPK